MLKPYFIWLDLRGASDDVEVQVKELLTRKDKRIEFATDANGRAKWLLIHFESDDNASGVPT
jgi:hypothetical protein